MKANFIEKFHSISINGRYIYGYLCLRNVIHAKGKASLPDGLDVIIREFVASNALDVWQERAEKVLPSVILDEANDKEFYKDIPYGFVLSLKRYYESQPALVKDIIEEIIWLGFSNLYGGFDTNITFQYIKQIIEWLVENEVDLPDFSKIIGCSVEENHGWGRLTDMSDFV